MKYDLSKAYVPFIHMYVPYWNLERVDINDSNWLFIKRSKLPWRLLLARVMKCSRSGILVVEHRF